jgi:spore coat assembly protein
MCVCQDVTIPGGREMTEFLAIGDLVVRKSYDQDVVFKVVSLNEGIALLRGICARVIADAPLSDLVKVNSDYAAMQEEHFEALRRKII